MGLQTPPPMRPTGALGRRGRPDPRGDRGSALSPHRPKRPRADQDRAGRGTRAPRPRLSSRQRMDRGGWSLSDKDRMPVQHLFETTEGDEVDTDDLKNATWKV